MRDIRPDYKRECPDMRFPKMSRAKHHKAKAAPESVLQDFTNKYLQLKGLTYLRLPESLFAAIFRNPNIDVWIKRHIKEAIAGWPDNLVLLPIGNGLNLALALELKSETGKLHGEQKVLDKQIELLVARTPESVESAIKAFEIWANKLSIKCKELQQ
jgi:hypothetical protein